MAPLTLMPIRRRDFWCKNCRSRPSLSWPHCRTIGSRPRIHDFGRSNQFRRDSPWARHRPLLRASALSTGADGLCHAGWNRRTRSSFHHLGLSSASDSRISARETPQSRNLRPLDDSSFYRLFRLLRTRLPGFLS